MPSTTPLPVYDEYLSYCSPFVLERPWDVLSLAPVAYSTLASPFVVLGQLQALFDRATLIESGLAVACGDELLWPAPFLTAGGSRVIPLRCEPTAAPFDLVGEWGTVRGGTLPVLAALGDGETLHALADVNGSLLITPDIDDMIILRSLSLPASTASGLANLNAEHLRRVQLALGWRNSRDQDPPLSVVPDRPPTDDESQDDDGESEPEAASAGPSLEALVGALGAAHPELILVGFQLRQLSAEPPPELAQVVESLASLERDFGFDLGRRVWLWTPSPEEVRRLGRCLEFGDLAHVRESVLDSLENSCRELFVPNAPEVDVPDLATARAELLRAETMMTGGPAEHERRERARRVLEEALERDVARPSINRAMMCENPAQRALRLVGGDLAEQALLQAAAVRAAMRGPLPAGGISGLSDYLKTVKALVDVTRGLSR